ncbi:MAG: outer membrane beta-barrel protein, partial [Alteromonadaceae bacterium]|nr:outer membrane beta-barrel protein [Alteromonadaceae bacterium]
TDPDALQAANLDNVPVLGSGMSLNANYAFFNKGDVTVSGMLGLYMWEAELSSVANGNVLNKDVDGTDFTLGLGAEYNFNEQVSSYLKLQRYQLDPNDVNEVQVGMSYRF